MLFFRLDKFEHFYKRSIYYVYAEADSLVWKHRFHEAPKIIFRWLICTTAEEDNESEHQSHSRHCDPPPQPKPPAVFTWYFILE